VGSVILWSFCIYLVVVNTVNSICSVFENILVLYGIHITYPLMRLHLFSGGRYTPGSEPLAYRYTILASNSKKSPAIHYQHERTRICVD
jgi:hypothetical protein